ILVAFPLAYLVNDRPDRGGAEQARPLRNGERGAEAARVGGQGTEQARALRDVLSQPAFYLLAVGSMCSIAAVGGTNQHLKLFLSLDRGYAQADAARIISLVLAISIAGRLFMGWLADRVARKYVMLLIYLLVAAAIPLLLASGSSSLMS